MATIALYLNLHSLCCLSTSSPTTQYAMGYNSSLRPCIPFVKHATFVRLRAPPCYMSTEIDSQKEAWTPDPARDLEERFAVVDTGKWACRSCSFTYDQFVGDPLYPIAAGTEFGKLPEDWRCPTCGAPKSSFSSQSVELAGFAQNQKFGFGTNSLTAGQKSLLIYGSLLIFFLLFLSGYFIQ